MNMHSLVTNYLVPILIGTGLAVFVFTVMVMAFVQIAPTPRTKAGRKVMNAAAAYLGGVAAEHPGVPVRDVRQQRHFRAPHIKRIGRME